MNAMCLLLDDDGAPLDANMTVSESSIVLHSRGGTMGVNAVNPDYSKALRLLLVRLAANKLAIQGAWVDSSRTQGLPLTDKEIFGPDDHLATPDESFRLMSSRMQLVGRAATASSSGGNPTKKIKIQLQDAISKGSLVSLLGLAERGVNTRLPAATFDKVQADNIWRAVRQFQDGYESREYGESTDYDLIADDGRRFPPKAVFGLAATEALGFPVLPKHFTAGAHSPCFRLLIAAGYEIVPKAESTSPDINDQVSSDPEWVEGNRAQQLHYRKERARGLSQAKKSQFIRDHGKLFCERCNEDPVLKYQTEDAVVCIEVHHREVMVSEMNDGHVTRLEDLECLCANCHRLTHRLLRNASIGT